MRLVSDWETILQIAQEEGQEHLSDEKQQYEHQKERYERKGAPEKHVTPVRPGGIGIFGGRLS